MSSLEPVHGFKGIPGFEVLVVQRVVQFHMAFEDHLSHQPVYGDHQITRKGDGQGGLYDGHQVKNGDDRDEKNHDHQVFKAGFHEYFIERGQIEKRSVRTGRQAFHDAQGENQGGDEQDGVSKGWIVDAHGAEEQYGGEQIDHGLLEHAEHVVEQIWDRHGGKRRRDVPALDRVVENGHGVTSDGRPDQRKQAFVDVHVIGKEHAHAVQRHHHDEGKGRKGKEQGLGCRDHHIVTDVADAGPFHHALACGADVDVLVVFRELESFFFNTGETVRSLAFFAVPVGFAERVIGAVFLHGFLLVGSFSYFILLSNH